MKTLKILAVAILLTATSHTVMAQCAGSQYVPPTTTDCNCGGSLGYTCDAGGDQINAYNKCGSTTSGGTNCVSSDGVIGTNKKCTASYSVSAALLCAANSAACIAYAVAEDWAEYAECVADAGDNCIFCGNILTCSETDTDIHGQVYSSVSGTCPNQ